MIIKEASPVATTDLGSATVANYAPQRRRVMQTVCLPLSEDDGITAADDITVLDPGTGRAERCQAEEWVKPYDSGSSRVLRLTFPAILDASDRRKSIEFRRSNAGALPTYSPRQHLLDRLAELQIQFFCGPSSQGYFCVIKQAGSALPTPIYSGTRSRLYRWFARVYEPSHAPALRTQFWCEFDVEVFHDEDYAAFWWRWGVDDPRIDEPDGVRRDSWTDYDTSVGLDFIPAGANSNGVRPVVFWPATYAAPDAPVFATGYGWRFVQDRRALALNGTVANQVLPWGTMGQGKGVLVFPGLTGSHGDTLRDESLAAWISTPYPVYGVGDDWLDKQEAFGPTGALPRPSKVCEWRQRRTFDSWRTQIENESFAQAQLGARIPYAWDAYAGEGQYVHQAPRFDATGAAGSWNKSPCYIPCTYRVPGYGMFAEKALGVFPWMMFYREVDGSLVTGANHPDLIIDKGSPGRYPGTNNGDMLGKTSLQAWRTSEFANSIITVQGAGAAGGLPHIGSDTAHWENGWLAMVPAIFGDRGLRRMAESLAYTVNWGSWQRDSWSPPGSTGQPRGWSRGMTQWAWFLYLFGRDNSLVNRCASAMHGWYFTPANDSTNGRYPGRIFTSFNDFMVWWQLGQGRPNPDVTRVILRDNPYTRPWEDAIGVLGAYGLWRMIAASHPTEAATFANYARGIAKDTFGMHSPREVDESGRILWTYYRPGSTSGSPPYVGNVYEPAAAAAIVAGGTRRMSRGEMSQNQWEICAGGSGGLAYQCDTCNDGFMRLGVPGSGTSAFTAAAAGYLLDMFGASVGDLLPTRYVLENMANVRGDEGNNGSIPRIQFLLDRHRWVGPAFEYIVPGNSTTRASNQVSNPAGISTARETIANIWIVNQTDRQLRSVNWTTGQIARTIDPGITPVDGAWSDVSCYERSGQSEVALLDGRSPTFSRTSYALAIGQEGATSGYSLVTFTLADNVPRAMLSVTWDPHVQQFLVLGVTQSGAGSLWRVPVQGGVATQDSVPGSGARVVLDVDQARRLDILQDGRLMVVARQDGSMEFYAYARGGYWGSPRSSVGMTAGHTAAAFTRHGRQDDALRVVTVGAQFVEVEV